MKLTKAMLLAGKGSSREDGKIGKNWSLWNYDYYGLNQKLKRTVQNLAEDWGWDCYSDEERAPSYAIDVIEHCIVRGLLEVPTPPGGPPPPWDQLHNETMTRLLGPDWKEKATNQENEQEESE